MAEHTPERKKQLGVAELTCYGIGNCIGSGIFVSMGSGIGFTGRSIPLALIAASIIIFFAYAYKILISGMFALPGGNYSQTALLQPPILVGVSALSNIFASLSFAMYGIAIVEYAATVFPGILPYKTMIAIGIITLFFLTTLFGGKFMGRFNMIMVVVLLIALLVYVIVGLPQVDFAAIKPGNEGYFSGGVVGFFMAVAMMSFACQGATMPIAMTADAREPKKTLPKAIILASVIVMVAYVIIGIVSSGVLPVEEVANKNLGVVAKQIFPYGVFVVFIIGGACFAIATSLYGTIAGVQHPMLVTIEDGWLPAFLGKKTKNGYPWVMMLTLYLIAIIPIFVDMGLQTLISLIMIPVMILNLINNVLMFSFVKRYSKAWEKSFFHMPKGLFYFTIIFAILCDALISLALFTTLERGDQYIILAMTVGLFGYSFYRLKAGKVNLHDIERARSEAEEEAKRSMEQEG